MSEIKRYSLIDCVVGKGYMATITEDPGGAWVKYADHAAEVERLRFKHLPECNYPRNECGVGGCICTVVNKNEVERLKAENMALRGALGYEVPADTPDNLFVNGIAEALHKQLAAKDAEIAALKARLQFTYCAYCGERFDVADEDAAKKAVEEHIFKCEKHPIAALTAALDEATMLLHEFQTDCGWDTTLERDFANIKTPASRALCEKLFRGEK